jgi:DNA-directed RNA polymerase specialized sigma24 family protein
MRESFRLNPGSEAPAENRGNTLSIPKLNSQPFDVLFAKYRSVLYFVALRVLGNHREAEDAVQRCFLSASANTPQFDCEGRFRSWLVRVLIDEALTILHKNSIRSPRSSEVLLSSLTDLHDDSLHDSLDFSPNQHRTPQGASGRDTLGENYGWY